jgi:hypothetical protein
MTAHFRLIVTLFVVLAAAAPAWAQSQNQRGQDRALFGGGTGDAEQLLSANSNVGATYFKTLSGMPTGLQGDVLPNSTWFGQGSAFLGYRLGWKWLQVDAAGGQLSYYFPDQKRWFRQTIENGTAAASHAWQLTQRTQLSVSESAGVQPAYYSALPTGYQPQLTSADPALTLPPDLTGFGGVFLMSQSGAGITHNLSRRVSLTGRYDFMRRWSVDRPDNLDLEQQSAAGDVRFSVTRHLSVRTGYRAYDSRFGPPDTPHVRSQNVDFGVDYNRGGSLQLTRKTTLSLNVGLGGLTDSAGQQRYFLLGGAGLTHEMGRTWASSIIYSRDLNFSSLFQEPVLTDNVVAGLTGLITERLTFQSSVGYSKGTVGFVGTNRGLTRAYGLVGLQTALTRYLALGTNYTYYYSTVESQVVVPVGLPRQTETQAARVYVSTWVPLFSRTRRPNATR